MFNDLYDPYVAAGARFGRGSRSGGRRGGGYAADPYAYGPGGRGRGGRGRGPAFGPSAPGFRRAGLIRFALLGLLNADGPKNGAQLIQGLTERSFGRWSPNPALIYGTLQQLEDEGLIRSATGESETGRSFELTEAGKEQLSQLESQPLAGAMVGGQLTSLRQAIVTTVAAVRQAAMSGDTELTAKVAELLGQTRQSIYKLLAGERE